MSLRIALTGATGFVGKALLPLLVGAGHEVVALVRNPRAIAFDRSVTVVEGDLNTRQALQTLTTSADVVVHVAGLVSAVRRQDFETANVGGTRALAEAAQRNGVRHFVFVSSLAARIPSLNHYAESKAAAEAVLTSLQGGMRVTVLRPAAVYGPGDAATLPLLKSLLSPRAIIPGSASARFGMVHVDDVAKALLQAVHSDRTGCFDLDDGSGGHGWTEIADIARVAFGVPQKMFFIPRLVALALGHVGDGIALLRGKAFVLNSGQMKQIYHGDWCVNEPCWPLQSPIPLQKGLPETIRWYQAKGLLPLLRSAVRKPTHDPTTG